MKILHNQDDLDLLAFQYLTNELSDCDYESFERQMEHDQEAREALARVVQITQTLGAVQRSCPITPASISPPVLQPAVRWQRATWAIGAIAACLALLLGYQTWQNSNTNTDRSVTSNSTATRNADSPQLAFAWLEAVDELAISGDETVVGSPLESEEVAADERFEDESSQYDAPDWMLAAISGLSGKNADSEAMQETGEN